MSAKEEIVNDGHLFTVRLEVPGGWIYSMYDKSHGILSSVFVPNLFAENKRKCGLCYDGKPCNQEMCPDDTVLAGEYNRLLVEAKRMSAELDKRHYDQDDLDNTVRAERERCIDELRQKYEIYGSDPITYWDAAEVLKTNAGIPKGAK